MSKQFALDPNYKQVPERIADFREKHPEGCLRPVNPDRPFWFETVDDKMFLVYAAAAYRTPNDPSPGIGMAWEPVPGLTPYTSNSELQNAETSAWGRAIVAVLASESKAVASAEDVRNRQAEATAPEPRRRSWPTEPPVDLAPIETRRDLFNRVKALDFVEAQAVTEWMAEHRLPAIKTLSEDQAVALDVRLALVEGEPEGDETPPESPESPDDPLERFEDGSLDARALQRITEAAIAEVKPMLVADVTAQLEARDMAVTGNGDTKRLRLAQVIARERFEQYRTAASMSVNAAEPAETLL